MQSMPDAARLIISCRSWWYSKVVEYFIYILKSPTFTHWMSPNRLCSNP